MTMSQERRERQEAAKESYKVQIPDQSCDNCRESHLCGRELRCALLDNRPVNVDGLCTAWRAA